MHVESKKPRELSIIILGHEQNTSPKIFRATLTPKLVLGTRFVVFHIGEAIFSTACPVQVSQLCALCLLACSIWISTRSAFAPIEWMRIASHFYFNLFPKSVSSFSKTWTRPGFRSARLATECDRPARMQSAMNRIAR